MDELQRLLAERAIRRRLLDYCRGVDRLDAELIASAYHPDGTDDHGAFRGLGTDFARYVVDALGQRATATLHTVGDSIVDFVGDDTARVETYVHAEHRCDGPDGPFLELFGGRYVDRFERRAGEWRIADRVCIHEWDRRVAVEPAFPAGRFTKGRRDRSDPAYGEA